MSAVLGDLSGWAAAVAAGAGVALWVRRPGRLSEVTPARHDRSPTHPYQRLLQPRDDAAPFLRRLLVASAGALAVSAALLSAGGRAVLLIPVLAPLLALTGAVVLGRLEPGRNRRRQQRLVLDLPQAFELLSACLAAGMPLRTATAAVATAFDGPVAEDLGRVLTLVDLGTPDVEAWRVLAGDPAWAGAAVDLARSVEAGTMMVEVLVHHATQARSRRRAELEVRAKAVGVRSVLPLMTCFLPAFMLLGVVPTVASAVVNALH